jgi:SAM-dependent methyltransferase
MSAAPREFLRTTFEQVPELYDQARPSYPAQLFDDLASLAELPEQARLLEIGCGPGKATVPLAERGYELTCVELGEQMAGVARRNLASFPRVEVVNADFESWQPERADFDAVVAFTAFHWIAPELRYAKPAELLRERGKLAIGWTKHVLLPDGDRFFVDVQEDYEAVVPDDPKTKESVGGPPHPDEVSDRSEEIAQSGLFRNVGAARYLWDVVYTADEYIAVLNTYSVNRAHADDTRERLFSRIRRRIESRPERTVRKTYLALLNVAEPV